MSQAQAKENDKHSRIVEAATKIFAQKGYFHSKISDVAETAGVAEGTIYLYFKSKEDLLISIFEHSMDRFIQQGKDELAKVVGSQERFKRFISLHLGLVQKNPDLAHVIQLELRQSSKFMKEYKANKFFDYLHIVEEIIEEGQKEGVFRKDIHPKIMRRAIFGAVDEMALEWVLMKDKKYSLEKCAEELTALFLNGMKV
jgi:TetR/AcrR family transcriptional regulator, fatty acid metabolism regulator protein